MIGIKIEDGRVTAEGVAELLKFMAFAPHQIQRDTETEWGNYCGDCKYHFNGWEITVFNDCDSFDYVDKVTGPNGETGDFDYWIENATCPTNLVLSEVTDALEARFAECDDEAGVP